MRIYPDYIVWKYKPLLVASLRFDENVKGPFSLLVFLGSCDGFVAIYLDKCVFPLLFYKNNNFTNNRFFFWDVQPICPTVCFG